MFINEIEDISKRYISNYGNYGRGRTSNWYSYRWLLWLLILVPIVILVVLFCCRKKRNSHKVVDNNQYYQTQQAGGYYGGQAYQNSGDQGYQQYPNAGGNAPPAQPNYDSQYPANDGYGGYSQQQGYKAEATEPVNANEFERPDGPPPAHYKS